MLTPLPPRPERRPYIEQFVRDAAAIGESAESALQAFYKADRQWIKADTERQRQLAKRANEIAALLVDNLSPQQIALLAAQHLARQSDATVERTIERGPNTRFTQD
jgi:hypothetical protein